MRLEVKTEERCLGQITRTLIHPEIEWGRGNCEICKYDCLNNPNCKVYRAKENRIPIRFFYIVEEINS